MSHERLPEHSDFSNLEAHIELTPQQLNQRLTAIRRRLLLEGVATPVIGATSLPLIYLSMVEYYGDDPKMFAALVAFKLICVAGAMGAMGMTALTGKQTYNDVKERGSILKTARERGLQISGTIFKRVR